jgi:hypothetical protein
MSRLLMVMAMLLLKVQRMLPLLLTHGQTRQTHMPTQTLRLPLLGNWQMVPPPLQLLLLLLLLTVVPLPLSPLLPLVVLQQMMYLLAAGCYCH